MTSSLSVVLLLGGAPPPPTLDLTLGSASVVAALTSGAADGMVLVERRLPPVLVPGTSTELQLQLGEVDLTLHADTETTDPVALEPGVAVALDVTGSTSGGEAAPEVAARTSSFDVRAAALSTVGDASALEGLLEPVGDRLGEPLLGTLAAFSLTPGDGLELTVVDVMTSGPEGGYLVIGVEPSVAP